MGKHDKTSGDSHQPDRPVPPSKPDKDNEGGGGTRGR